ncbi:MAG TPA: DinB family protein [Bacillota bacterium]|nr:DinB family protein [Bacillota bacterium]
MDVGLETIYRWVQRSREPLMTALQALGSERYQAPQATLAGESVRDRHIHIANCYLFWAAKIALGEDPPDLRPADYADAAASRAAFTVADAAVERLLERFAGRMDEPLERAVWGQTERLTPRWLLAHPITHEFNHKGQIVVVVRMFGVEPGDTDMVRPFGPPPA